MKYRAEIDGLRALAVIPVILYHAGFKLFGGGYVGVDVFFVISGYLITTIILAELDTGTFSLIHFYERRARRILPALFVVMFACLPFAWFWLLPDAMKQFSESLVAVSTFASNILFWRTSGYFDTATELKPLIHTWSLAVEEQYYVLFPLFLMLAWKLGKRWIVGLLGVVFVISLAGAQWLSVTHPSFNFFMLPTRGWELLIGAFIAFYYAHHNIKRHNHNIEQLSSLIGLLLIIYSIFAYNDQTPFPSVYALAPTLGAALIIIFATHKTIVGKLLGSKLFVAIGLISYSAYLWHQPMFAFARERSFDEPSLYLMGALAVSSFAFAYLSWKYVERPFRNKHRLSRKKVFIFAIAGSSFFICTGLAGHITKYFINAESIQEITINTNFPKLKRNDPKDWKECLNSGGTPRDDFVQKPCVYVSPNGQGSKILLIGDSHAQVLHFQIASMLEAPNSISLYAGGSCPPFFTNLDTSCSKFHKEAAEYAIKKEKINTVILSARWSAYLRDKTFFMNDGGRIPPNNPFYKEVYATDKVKEEIRGVINFWLNNGTDVVFVTDYPTDGIDMGRRMKKAAYFNTELNRQIGTVEQREYKTWTIPLTEVIDSFSYNPKFHIVDSYKVICGNVKTCPLITEEGPLLGDSNHASAIGSEILAVYISKIISQINTISK